MTLRVLLVDDAEDIRVIARMSLERVGGMRVVAVSSGEAAIEAVTGDGPFDVVLLDVMMPGMDGPSTLEALREKGLEAQVPIVFLTAKGQPSERQRLGSLGVVGVISKPFDPLELPGELGRLLDQAPYPT